MQPQKCISLHRHYIWGRISQFSLTFHSDSQHIKYILWNNLLVLKIWTDNIRVARWFTGIFFTHLEQLQFSCWSAQPIKTRDACNPKRPWRQESGSGGVHRKGIWEIWSTWSMFIHDQRKPRIVNMKTHCIVGYLEPLFGRVTFWNGRQEILTA